MRKIVSACIFSALCFHVGAQKNWDAVINTSAAKIEAKCIAWRRQLHENPELGNREFKKGKEGGAELMVKEGVMDAPKVDVMFGLHIKSQIEVGKISVRAGGFYAGVSDMKIVVKGKPSHGAYPWNSIDPVVASAQIINA